MCDAYHAMTSGRPYKEPLDPAEAIEELRRWAGSQFDPGVVEVFAGLVDADGLQTSDIGHQASELKTAPI